MKHKCEIQWVGTPGIPQVPPFGATPHDDEAIGIATHHVVDKNGEETTNSFPICEKHLKKMPRPGWESGPGMWWTFEPFKNKRQHEDT